MQKIIYERESALEKRKTTELEIIDRMLTQNRVSPKTYENKKIEIEKWVEAEQIQIQ
jgi:hypothetical protein